MTTTELVRSTIEDDAFRAGACAALAPIDAPATELSPIGRGNNKHTFVVRFADRDPVVVQLGSEPARIRTEARVLREIRRRTDVPVAPVLASGRQAGVGYLLTAYVAGDDLHERFSAFAPKTRRDLARSFGTALATLHEAFQFDGYGTVEATERELTTSQDDWAAWFREYSRRAIDRLPDAFDPLRSALDALCSEAPIDARPQARLYPWDLRPGNALVADRRVRALVDWERPLAAPAPLSVAKTEYLVADWYVSEPERLRDAFRAGYTSVRPSPDVRACHRVAAIADSAVDSAGTVTAPRYPELDRDEAVAVHRRALEAALDRRR